MNMKKKRNKKGRVKRKGRGEGYVKIWEREEVGENM